MKKEKLILFLHNLNGGGAERIMAKLANGFYEKDIDITLVLVNKTGTYLDLINPGIPIVNLGSNGTLLSITSFYKYIKNLSNYYDKIKILSTLGSANVVNVWIKILLSQKIESYLREASTPAMDFKIGTFSKKINSILSKIFYRYGDLLICVSEGVKNDSKRFYGLKDNQLHIIYNPIYSESIINKSKNDIDEIEIYERGPVIIGIGRILPVKGFDVLISAFSKAKKEITNLQLIILGKYENKPKYFQKLNKLVVALNLQDSVHFLGFKKNPFKYLGKSQLFVLSSFYEGLPGTLIQAMSLGIPVISTDCPNGPNEILENGKFGKLLPTGNDKKMAEAIVNSIQGENIDPEKLKKRAQEFNLENAVTNYMKIMNL